MKYLLSLLTLLFLVVAFFSCGDTPDSADDGKLNIITTTSMIKDAVDVIAGDKVEAVVTLCGPGVDPHTYSATVQDVERMKRADLIFYNGLNLEDRLGELLSKMQDKSFAVAEAIPKDSLYILQHSGGKAEVDPHVWNDLILWKYSVIFISEKLGEKDPENAAYYDSTAKVYLAKLDEVHNYAIQKFESIPIARRKLISSHDGFNYFARQYGFESRAILGISTSSEAGIKSIQDLRDFIVANDVKVAFLETMVNSKGLQALKESVAAKGRDLEIVDDPLFSDAVGATPPLDNFLNCYKHNIDVISKNLKP